MCGRNLRSVARPGKPDPASLSESVRGVNRYLRLNRKNKINAAFGLPTLSLQARPHRGDFPIQITTLGGNCDVFGLAAHNASWGIFWVCGDVRARSEEHTSELQS